VLVPGEPRPWDQSTRFHVISRQCFVSSPALKIPHNSFLSCLFALLTTTTYQHTTKMANAQQPVLPTAGLDVTESIAQNISQSFDCSAYACGGTIKVKKAEAPHPGPAVTIRWDAAQSIEKLTLPQPSANTDEADADDPLAKLLQGTSPAGFGYQGKNVIDESYRKASKLDTSAFSTDFCPYEAGIIDVIGQALLPQRPSQYQGIRAELYKLNVRVLQNPLLDVTVY
jgi:hypothetical protein